MAAEDSSTVRIKDLEDRCRAAEVSSEDARRKLKELENEIDRVEGEG
jgi:hypothetical protein